MATVEGLKRTPEIHHHTVRNLAVGLVGVAVAAAGVGVAINAGKGEPQPSQVPGGGIVEPSSSPTPTPFTTESPVVVIPSESPVAKITPSPTLEITPVPALTASEVAEQIINQDKADVKKTSITDIKNSVNELWSKYGTELSQISYKDSPAGKLSKDFYNIYVNFIANGRDKNLSTKELIDQRISFDAGFTVVQLYAYDKVTDAGAKKALVLLADKIYDYGRTSIPPYPGQPARNMEELNQFIPVILSSELK